MENNTINTDKKASKSTLYFVLFLVVLIVGLIAVKYLIAFFTK